MQDALFNITEEAPADGPDIVIHRGEFSIVPMDIPIEWKQYQIETEYGTYDNPRMEAWYGLSYSYSGLEFDTQPLTKELEAIRQKAMQLSGVQYNSVLCNLYRDGKDSVAFHADDERELGPTPNIASITLGSSRRFVMRRKDNHDIKFETELHHGDLLIMKGTTQQEWHHSVPKTAKPVGPRINLTYRWIFEELLTK